MKPLLQIVLIFIMGISIGACNPMKVIDPSDPQFNPDNFKFSDYYDNDEMSLAEAYRILFPPGTPKAFVDRVLVGAGRAKGGNLGQKNGYDMYAYRVPKRIKDLKNASKVIFFYDNKGGVVNISMNGGFDLYKNQPRFVK